MLFLFLSIISSFISSTPVCATTGVNMRYGPCTWYSKAFSCSKGDSFTPTGQVSTGCGYEWIKFTNGKWAARNYFSEEACNNLPGNTPVTSSSFTAQKLKGCMPYITLYDANMYIDELNSAMASGNVNTCDRVSAFLAQVGHESGDLRWWEELDDGTQYEGRVDLCNTEPGDGPKYKGRGPIQLTGKCNYGAAGADLNLDLLGDPYQVATDKEIGLLTTVWYWNGHSLNSLADQGTQAGFDAITLAINGGTNGAQDRNYRYTLCRSYLGCHL